MTKNWETTHRVDRWSGMGPFMWPLIVAAAANDAAAAFFRGLAQSSGGADLQPLTEPEWATKNTIALELPSMQLRDFSTAKSGLATLICAPFALHGATVADFAPGHSIVEALRLSGFSCLFVTDWRSAAPEMRFFEIDNYLADLNVAIDELNPPVDLIGLCQGGWLSLAYAARFPAKVRRIVLVGAPVDFHAAPSLLSQTVASLPFSALERLVEVGTGRVLGRDILEGWSSLLNAHEPDEVLQLSQTIDPDQRRELVARFCNWNAWTVDLPGTYYLEIVDRLYRHNQIARGEFVALGRQINLADIQAPLLMLGGRDDQIASPEQLFGATQLVGSNKAAIGTLLEPCGHLSLFLGARTLARTWPRIARWLLSDSQMAKAS